MAHRLIIDRWQPTPVNKLLSRWSGAKLKQADRAIVLAESRLQRVPKATGPRRVTLTIVLRPRQRGCDPDAYFKSLCDALTHAGLLLDDRRQCVELAPVRYERGPAMASVIELEDL